MTEATPGSPDQADSKCGHPPAMDVECVCHCAGCADPRIPRGEPGYCICPQCTVCRVEPHEKNGRTP